MAAERDFDLLDDYLSNRLDQAGRSAFEDKLTRDPELKNQYALQKELVDGIRRVRIAELKAMLSNVPVPPLKPAGSTIGAKVAAWTVVAGALGAGAYYFFRSDTEKTQPEQSVTTTPPAEADPQTLPEVQAMDTTTPQDAHKVDQSPVVAHEPAAAGETPPQKPEPVVPQNTDTAERTSEPRIDVFDPSEDGDASSQPPVTGDRATPPAERESIAVEVNANHKKYTFHYQFKEGRLFLYGPFERGLYEILEFFSGEQRTVFLLYQGNYYLLQDNNEKLKPLEKITDSALIRKLKESRNR